MEVIKTVAKQLYQHSLLRYVIIGGTTFALDFFLLVFIHSLLNINLLIAATVSYWVSIAFNFLANRYWSFGATDTNIMKHLLSYLCLLGFNYLFTLAFLAVTTDMGLHYTIAKVIAVAIQTSWTYIAYKKFIFR